MSKQTDSLGKQPLDVNVLISRHAAHTDEELDAHLNIEVEICSS